MFERLLVGFTNFSGFKGGQLHHRRKYVFIIILKNKSGSRKLNPTLCFITDLLKDENPQRKPCHVKTFHSTKLNLQNEYIPNSKKSFQLGILALPVQNTYTLPPGKNTHQLKRRRESISDNVKYKKQNALEFTFT